MRTVGELQRERVFARRELKRRFRLALSVMLVRRIHGDDRTRCHGLTVDDDVMMAGRLIFGVFAGRSNGLARHGEIDFKFRSYFRSVFERNKANPIRWSRLRGGCGRFSFGRRLCGRLGCFGFGFVLGASKSAESERNEKGHQYMGVSLRGSPL